jgi:ATP-dependent DNA helicase PIF1
VISNTDRLCALSNSDALTIQLFVAVSLARCGFAFESPAWNKGAIQMVELREVVRQSGDTSFINLLNQVRLGICTTQITQALEACHVSRKPIPTDGIVPTKLYCTNRNVDAENDRNLAALKGKEITFHASDWFKGSYTNDVQKNLAEAMNKKMPAQLKLKVGAQVILTRNMPDRNLVNGSRGVVKSFQEARIDLDDEDYSNYTYSKSSETKLFPVVHFSNGVQMLVRDESVFQGGSTGAMTRSQLPLKLAWSLTVHKSQGMTIERAELQLDDAFDYGQVYVALSRITSLDGLWVRGGSITQSVVKAHPKVKRFYERSGSSVVANA